MTRVLFSPSSGQAVAAFPSPIGILLAGLLGGPPRSCRAKRPADQSSNDWLKAKLRFRGPFTAMTNLIVKTARDRRPRHHPRVSNPSWRNPRRLPSPAFPHWLSDDLSPR